MYSSAHKWWRLAGQEAEVEVSARCQPTLYSEDARSYVLAVVSHALSVVSNRLHDILLLVFEALVENAGIVRMVTASWLEMGLGFDENSMQHIPVRSDVVEHACGRVIRARNTASLRGPTTPTHLHPDAIRPGGRGREVALRIRRQDRSDGSACRVVQVDLSDRCDGLVPCRRVGLGDVR